jgi:hypothetical protein
MSTFHRPGPRQNVHRKRKVVQPHAGTHSFGTGKKPASADRSGGSFLNPGSAAATRAALLYQQGGYGPGK